MPMQPTAPSNVLRGRILVVDDESLMLETLSDLLAGQGYEVLIATNAKGLRDCFEGPQPDVVLLDLKLPDGYGIDLLPVVKKQWPETEVIMLTGQGTIADA